MRLIEVPSGPVAYLKNGVIRYHKRDIVMVVTKAKRQPFYKSTGHSSGMPDRWLPFDGIMYPTVYGAEWFDKTEYTVNPEQPWDKYGFGEFHRFGTRYNLDISNALGQMDIPKGVETDSAMEVNLFLGVAERYSPEIYKKLKLVRC